MRLVHRTYYWGTHIDPANSIKDSDIDANLIWTQVSCGGVSLGTLHATRCVEILLCLHMRTRTRVHAHRVIGPIACAPSALLVFLK